METLLLSRSEIKQLLDPEAALKLLCMAFHKYSDRRGVVPQRVRSELPGPGTTTVLFPGTYHDIPAYSVKVHAKFPGQNPSIRGVLLLHDNQTGDLLVVMDSTYLTAVRTGLVSALATDLLARKDARSVAVIGTGVQGEFQLRFLNRLRKIDKVIAFDSVPEVATRFAKRMTDELSISICASPSLVYALSEADIILTATWSREPFLYPGMVPKGAHISTLGADEPGKCEIDSCLIRKSVFICDDRDLAVNMGAIGAAGLGAEAISAELGEVISGIHPGRTETDQITIFGSVGVAFQDLVVAWQVYESACAEGIANYFKFIDHADSEVNR